MHHTTAFSVWEKKEKLKLFPLQPWIRLQHTLNRQLEFSKGLKPQMQVNPSPHPFQDQGNMMTVPYLLNLRRRAWFDFDGSVTSCWYHTWLPMPTSTVTQVSKLVLTHERNSLVVCVYACAYAARLSSHHVLRWFMRQRRNAPIHTQWHL